MLFLASLLTLASLSDDDRKVCANVSILAEEIMRDRQRSVPMREKVEVHAGNQLALLIIQGAYDRPAYSTEECKRREAVEYGSYWYGRCVKARTAKE